MPNQSPKAANRHYVPALDGLRTFAVGTVAINHLSWKALPGGSIGVDIFFVLSGFLITSVLLREREATGRISLLAFYMRRALRLMPALVLLVLGELLIEATIGGAGDHPIGSALLTITYLMDFVRAFSLYSELSAIGHTWSLAVEEHFYLVWPLLIAPLMVLSARRRAPAILIGIVLLALWRVALLLQGAGHNRIYYAFDVRSDQLLVGCALATWLFYGPAARLAGPLARLWPLAATGLAAIMIVGEGDTALRTATLPLITAVCSAVLILAVSGPNGGWLTRITSTRPMVELGKISYGIYLWHYPLLFNMRAHTLSRGAALAAVIAAIGVAWLSYHYFEMPFLRLKRRFERGGETGRPLGTPAADGAAAGTPATAVP